MFFSSLIVWRCFLDHPCCPGLTYRANSFAEEIDSLRLALEKQEETQRDRDDERLANEVREEERNFEHNLQSKSLRARLCRTLNQLHDAEEAGELVLTCLKCTKLFKDPYIMGPCGHTLCAGCCGAGGGNEEELPVEGNSGWVLGGGGVDSKKRKKTACHACVNNQQKGDGDDKSICVGMAPNRALATLVTKFMFRRQLLKSLTEVGNKLWQEQPRVSFNEVSCVRGHVLKGDQVYT